MTKVKTSVCLTLFLALVQPVLPANAQQAKPIEALPPQTVGPETSDLDTITNEAVDPRTTAPTAKPLFADDVFESQFELTDGYRSGRDGRGSGDDAADGARDGGGLTRPASATTTRETITFTDTKEDAFSLAIGPEGRVYALDTAGNIFLWSNARRGFLEFEGQVTRLVGGPDGTLWGINALGRIFFFDGRRWSQVRGEVASDIAVNRNGDVVLTREDGLVKRLDPSLNRFVIDPSIRAVQIALFTDGTIVAIRQNNQVQLCDEGTCTNLRQRATALAIGPDDSLFLIDTNGRLLRSTDRGESFTRIPTLGRDVSRVAVGPNGFPWVVTVDGDVLASRFFDRDESADNRIRVSVLGDTVGSGRTSEVVSNQQSSRITFTRTLRFETFRAENDRFAILSDLVIGNDENTYITGTQLLSLTPEMDRFDERRRRFIEVPFPFPEAVHAFDVEDDGKTFWGITTSPPVKIFRSTNNGASIRTFTIPSAPAFSFGTDLTLDNDGNVYVIVGERIFRKGRNAAQFRQFSTQVARTIAIGMDDNIWITNDQNVVLRSDGDRFVNPARRQTKVSGLAVATDGSVFVIAADDMGNPQLFRWNASNRSFDAIRNTVPSRLSVTEDGLPWFTEGLDVKRARRR